MNTNKKKDQQVNMGGNGEFNEEPKPYQPKESTVHKPNDGIDATSDTINRTYKGDVTIDHDLFKLQAAKFLKNISIDINNPIWMPAEHCHFYHSHDSSGKRLEKSSATGGHFHEMEVKVDKKGNLSATCSRPLKRVWNPKKRRYENTPFNSGAAEGAGDNHVHEVTYIKSDKIEIRKLNSEAAKFQSAYARL